MYGYLFLAIMAVFSWFLVNLAGFDESGPDSVLAKGPDFFSANYTKWQMDEQGMLKNKLFADKMVHYRDDGKTHFTNPQYTLFSDSNNNVKHQQTPPWVITSDSGISSADGKDLLLNGKVSIERTGAVGIKPLKINTTDLKVKPEISYAETEDWAELISLPNTTTGTGMKLVFKQPIHIELLANVKGKYETK